MHTTAHAIVLHLAKYSDKASILHTYTQENGRTQYMVYGLSSPQKKASLALFEPLTYLEIEATQRSNSSIQTLSNAHILYTPTLSRTDMSRRSIALFVAEILYNTLRHPLPDNLLFAFLVQFIDSLDTVLAPENLHLTFLWQYTEYLGIMPSLHSNGTYLDMTTGVMTDYPPRHTDYFTPEQTFILRQLAAQKPVQINRSMRQNLLRQLCHYYELQISDFYPPKSLDILFELFND